jgi:hypothetical protein
VNPFPPGTPLEVVTVEGDVDLDTAAAIGRAAARLHLRAERCPDRGGPAGMQRVLEETRLELERFSEVFDRDVFERLTAELLAAFRRQATLLDFVAPTGGCASAPGPTGHPTPIGRVSTSSSISRCSLPTSCTATWPRTRISS